MSFKWVLLSVLLLIGILYGNTTWAKDGILGLTSAQVNLGDVIFLGGVLLAGIAGYSIFRIIRRRRSSKEIEDINSEKQDLMEKDREQAYFLQNISHEFRTPLTLIMEPLEKLKGAYPSDIDLDVALKNSKRLYRLVEHLLDFEKVSNRKYSLKLSPIKIASFLVQSKEFIKSLCKEKNIHFNMNINCDKDLLIMGQVDVLEKIVFNYISNAIKFAPHGGHIIVELTQIEDRIKVEVKDNGEGLSQEEKDNIFKVFYQGDSGPNRKFEGSGVGLALVKKYALKMNGTVGVETKEGLGSTFWVDFPIIEEEKSVLDFLFVDDEEKYRKIVEDMILDKLDNISYKIVENVRDAKEIVKKHRVKCVLSDSRMPGEDGTEFLMYVGREEPLTTRYLITGDADVQILKRAINKAKIDQVIYKPIDVDKLTKLVEKTINESPIKDKITFNDDYKPQDWYFADLPEGDVNLEIEDEESEEISEEDTEENEAPRVLVVDDIQAMRSLVCKALISEGYDVIEAPDGKKGFEYAKKYKPDLVITDWMMPNMSGPDLIKALHNENELSSVPTILLTVKSDDDSRQQSHRIGANCYLAKPFDGAELQSIVKSLLRLKETEQKVKDLNKHLSENVLKRYLHPKLVDDIVNGVVKLDDTPKIKSITILFSDLCDFTDSSQQLGARNMAKILNEYLTEMSKVIFEAGGNIDKFIGDSIMVLFGAPNDMSHDDQVKNALECSKKMHLALERLNEKWSSEGKPEFKMRIGIHHGPAIVGNFGSPVRSDYTAIGQTVNIASRIEAAAGNNEVLVSETIRDFLNDYNWEKAGVYDLKGVGQKQNLYRVCHAELKKAA